MTTITRDEIPDVMAVLGFTPVGTHTTSGWGHDDRQGTMHFVSTGDWSADGDPDAPIWCIRQSIIKDAQIIKSEPLMTSAKLADVVTLWHRLQSLAPSTTSSLS